MTAMWTTSILTLLPALLAVAAASDPLVALPPDPCVYIPQSMLRRAQCVVRDNQTWVVIQNRQKGDVRFDRPWREYAEGFGDINGDYWLGLEAMHHFCNGYRDEPHCQLRVELTYPGTPKRKNPETEDGHYVAVYRWFRIGEGLRENYMLHVYDYDKNASTLLDKLKGDSLVPFSTYDRDHDAAPNGFSCSVAEGNVGWWYYGCSIVLLNHNDMNGNMWPSLEWRGGITSTRMMVLLP